MADNTVLFKTVLGSYEEFISTPLALETIPIMKVYGDASGGSKPIGIAVEEWTSEVYRILLRHYRNYNICYDNEDDFLDRLWERIENHVPNYFQRKYYYNRLLQMSDSELLDSGEQINNFIAHTDDEVPEVFNKLKNITNQQQSKSFGAYSSKLRGQIYNAQMDLIRDFCRKFEGLFILLSSSSNYYG